MAQKINERLRCELLDIVNELHAPDDNDDSDRGSLERLDIDKMRKVIGETVNRLKICDDMEKELRTARKWFVGRINSLKRAGKFLYRVETGYKEVSTSDETPILSLINSLGDITYQLKRLSKRVKEQSLRPSVHQKSELETYKS
ncbi:MAG: hypothetical protein KAR42_05400 [candidate division Zixibacteria bacterium]|nr:hypothetical protein [candidate division Zixibacteria bacterium]